MASDIQPVAGSKGGDVDGRTILISVDRSQQAEQAFDCKIIENALCILVGPYRLCCGKPWKIATNLRYTVMQDAVAHWS